MATVTTELAKLLGLSNEEFEDMITWIKEYKIEDDELISILKHLMMDEMVR